MLNLIVLEITISY